MNEDIQRVIQAKEDIDRTFLDVILANIEQEARKVGISKIEVLPWITQMYDSHGKREENAQIDEMIEIYEKHYPSGFLGLWTRVSGW